MIKKSEIEDKLRKTYEEEIERLEKAIDKALSTNRIPMRISVEGFQKVSIETIKEKYEKCGGYTVQRSFGDQRDPCNDLLFS
jgi:isopropylmalate/homocitrate/citramalate synthase